LLDYVVYQTDRFTPLSVVLFFSDIHLRYGRDREVERALIECLRSQEGSVERLYLLGDVFDEYIEYRHLVPKGFVRFQSILAEWSDRGIPVTYLIGNHDPWHRDYFERELGVRVCRGPILEPLVNHNVYLEHGDGVDPSDRTYRLLRPWLRHPLPVWIYRTLLPGDFGMGLAKWVNRVQGDEEIKESTINALRRHALNVLKETPADLVVMGHSHASDSVEWPEGRYVNPGSWRHTQTYAALDEQGLLLLRWNGTRSVEVVAGMEGWRPARPFENKS
jgi:UDP-2,3-diacylglucosamine hydrolase